MYTHSDVYNENQTIPVCGKLYVNHGTFLPQNFNGLNKLLVREGVE